MRPLDSELFEENGFVLLKNFFNEDQSSTLALYTRCLLELNLKRAQKDLLHNFNPSKYHQLLDVDHHMIASSTYRYFIPPVDICNILEMPKLMNLLSVLADTDSFVRWQDPGYGWLGYRLVRPNLNDGYPPSCKNWGAAAGVYSLWIPIFGCTQFSSIRFLPGSHKKKFNSYLPDSSKFTSGELRLADEVPHSDFVRPLCNLGDAIIYHPATIHSEDTVDKNLTRINLEYRYMPLGHE